MALLTVCVPCFNASRTIEVAITSLLSQTFRDFECIVIDNCSVDNTFDILVRLVSGDSRFKLIRNDVNQGAADSFYRLGMMVQTEYMCYLSSDDYFASDYLERALALLVASPSVVCVTGRTLRFRANGFSRYSDGTFSIDDRCPKARMGKYLEAVTDNSRFHGVYRSSTIQKINLKMTLFAGDLAFTLLTLREGAHIEIKSNSPMVWRELPSGMAKYFPGGSLFSLKAIGLLLFPARSLVLVVMRRLRLDEIFYLLPNLLWINTVLFYSVLMNYASTIKAKLQRSIPADS